ncbi:MAG: aryl-sulfate sulfotransferase, partial [Pirellulales bacterium]
VWEWHLWDHLVQDFDKDKPNYGNVAEHPELVNLNYGEDALAPIAANKDAADKLKSVGYIGAGGGPGRSRANPDWTHVNGVAYHAGLDQVMISVHNFSEFWIIDHSTTSAEAAGHSGGRSGKGGDLLYRWGNPRAYRAGKKEDQKLFAQHNAHWIAKGMPGEGHVLVFNNGGNRPDGSYSSVDEIVLPVDAKGRYTRQPGAAFGPDEPTWSYSAPKKTDFYSFFISGAQRLPSGNTLICSGANGTFFEVTPEKEVVWKYVNPVKGGLGSPGGFGPPPRPGTVIPPIARVFLAVTPEQAAQLDEAQTYVDKRLATLLTADQRKQFEEPLPPGQPNPPPPPNPGGNPPPPGPGNFGPSYQAGQLLTEADQRRLKFTDAQKKDLAALQKDVDGKLEKLLDDEQRKQTKSGFAFGGPPPGAGGPGGPPPGGGPFGAPPQPGQLLPALVRGALKLTEEQKEQLDAFQTQVDERFATLLSEEQQKQLKEARGVASMAPPGQLVSNTLQARLKLTADQKNQLQALQKEADAKIAALLSDEQKKQLKDVQANPPRGGAFAGGPGGAGPGQPSGPPGGPGGP